MLAPVWAISYALSAIFIPRRRTSMNYYDDNSHDVRDLVLKLLGAGLTNVKRINFSVSYSQNRKLSAVIIEPSPSSTIQALIFFYTRSLRLYDAIGYRGRRLYRINRSGDSLKRLDRLNQFILKKSPRFSPISIRKIKEETNSDIGDELKDQQIQRLKDRLQIEKDNNRSLRNQMKVLRTRKGS
jgi:hypothetical protein